MLGSKYCSGFYTGIRSNCVVKIEIFYVDNMQKGEKGVGLGMPHLNAIQVYCLIKHVLIQQIFISLTTANV